MASAFIGLTVKVLLTSGTSLKGHVANVDPNTQRLMLQDGKPLFPSSLCIVGCQKRSFSVTDLTTKISHCIISRDPVRRRENRKGFALVQRRRRRDQGSSSPAYSACRPPASSCGRLTRHVCHLNFDSDHLHEPSSSAASTAAQPARCSPSA